MIINAVHIKNDFKQIFRNPMMVLFFILPILLSVIAKLVITLLIPYLQRFIAIDATPYYSYILAAILTEAPLSLGMVSGFMMLDDKDGRIFELMSITPLGESGYLFNRMLFPMTASFLYTFSSYYIVGIYNVPLVTLFCIALCMAILTVSASLILALIATDKVKGLTYAKAINLLSLFTLTDLLGIKWLSAVSYAVPTYWITKIVQNPMNPIVILLAFTVSAVWVVCVLWVWKRKA